MDENVFPNDEKEFTLNRILSISSGLQGVLIMLNARFMIESIVNVLITCLFLLSYLIIFILMPRTKRNYLSFILSFLFFVCVLIFVNK
ncbi:hypothetical protein CN601_20820 [Bacillus sp. AFS017336]|nr:hypothetical protein CN692_19990 [Bacillus sp. AFS002410]PEL06773.1 hypothetical protein CN601_20820 [Bacillus sp. AFS017336]